ncbi:hypothetical protein GGX14DRAFT_579970 [Mycena pura]|uniref:Uncharacterized protein n=1 Tax=Mycena pura TaxID=153505 RepID=A0AAD6UQS9_9AGAR|nr:hypothetical protein GGX14DRAFT_579970 [Mycena pura]
MFWPAATLPAAAPGSNAAPQALAFDARCLCNAPAGACVGSVALQRRPPCCHPPPLPRCNGAQRAAGACSRGNGPSLSTPVPAAALQLRCRVATPVPHHRPTFPPSPQLRCNAARNMEFIVQQVQPGLDANTLGASAGASGGHPFDWLVRLMNALLPTPVTDLGPIHRVVASFDVVWIGDGRFDIVEHVELSRTRKDAVDGLATEPLDTCLPPIGMASESAAAVLRHAAVITAGWAATKDTMSPGAKCAGDKLTVVSQVVRDDTLDERRDSAACCSESGGPNYLYENPSPLGVQISSSTVGDKTAVMEKMSGVPALMPSAVTRQGRVEGASMGNKFKWAFSMNNWNESIDDSCTLRLLPSSWTSQKAYSRLVLPEPDFKGSPVSEFIGRQDELDVVSQVVRDDTVLREQNNSAADCKPKEDYIGFSVLPELEFGQSLLDEFWSRVDKAINDSTECRGLDSVGRKVAIGFCL